MRLPAPHAGVRVPAHTAALVLVDRALDLASPSLHGEHLLDRMFGTPAGHQGSR